MADPAVTANPPADTAAEPFDLAGELSDRAIAMLAALLLDVADAPGDTTTPSPEEPAA